jgi:dipeptidyl aminopeptidase/acylaminoacyl peptidase
MGGARWVGFLFLAASAAAGQPPSASWRTIETAHCRVHYPAPFEAWARHVAGEIEGMREDAAGLIGSAPSRRIEVVVCDPDADANGAAVPYLDRPEILLWARPPGSESGQGDYTDWMRLLATHEMAHVVQLARPGRGVGGFLERLSPAPFGPLALFLPRWVIEGYATLVEGALTGSGRPNSTFRAMVLRQLAIEGKLPRYDELDRKRGWLGGSMAYLAGSAYLEWLSDRAGPDSLPALWGRMASPGGGSFETSFRSVFGGSARDLYERFAAGTTARAIEEEKALVQAGIVEGVAWRRLEGGTLSPQVSPDGTRLLARRDPKRGESLIAIWELPATGAPELDFAGAPRWTLPRANGYAAADPRWMPDGRRVLFTRRSPGGDGVLRLDLLLWEPESGRVRFLTRGADVGDADPTPDGRAAVAVRDRFGASALVRVDLASGRLVAIPVRIPFEEAWPVWSHPRVSPDGTRIAVLLHAGGQWRLATLPIGGGEVREVAVAGSPAAAAAWSADGRRLFVATDATGIWNLVSVSAADPGEAPEETLTRVTGGAFAPAPTPDGRQVFFLDLTAKGVDLRRLDLAQARPGPSAPRVEPAFPVLPPRTPPERPAVAIAPAPAGRPYDLWETQTVRSLVNFALGPSGSTAQLGLDGDDVVGRLHWLAVGSIGSAAGPRGGTIAAAYRGWPVELSAQLFSSLEKPGSQGLAPRPAFDEERAGGWAGASWGRPFSWGSVRVEGGGGGTRIDALADGRSLTRGLGSLAAAASFGRTHNRWGFALGAEVAGTLGSTAGSAWRQGLAAVRVSGISPFARLTLAAAGGETGGAASRFDLFSIGGLPSTILPRGLDRNRILSAALPADVQFGRRYALLRAELSAAAFPVVLYGEWSRASSGAEPLPEPVRVAGGEVRLDELVPAEFGRTIGFRVGVAGLWSEAPPIRAARGYAFLVYRP